MYLMKWQVHVNMTAMDDNVPELPSTCLKADVSEKHDGVITAVGTM